MKLYLFGLIAGALLALAGGCATQAPESTTTGVDTGVIVGEVGDPRNRARIHTELAAAYYSRGSMAVALEELRTAAAAGPPPTWSGSIRGADAILFRSGDRGASFHPIGNGFRPQRGMLMRLRPMPDDSGEFFGVANDGTVIRGYENGEVAEPATIAEKLPPAYDLVTVP